MARKLFFLARAGRSTPAPGGRPAPWPKGQIASKSLTPPSSLLLKSANSASMSISNCCFLDLQEAGKMVWYFHLLKIFPQFVVIHTVRGFGIVNKAEIDVFLELFFSVIQQILAI